MTILKVTHAPGLRLHVHGQKKDRYKITNYRYMTGG